MHMGSGHERRQHPRAVVSWPVIIKTSRGFMAGETKDAQKVTWVLTLVEEQNIVPKTYYKKLVNTNDIWEVRAQSANNAYRLLCFQYKNKIIVLTNGFQKKTQKTPKSEIQLAEKRKEDWLRRNK